MLLQETYNVVALRRNVEVGDTHMLTVATLIAIIILFYAVR